MGSNGKLGSKVSDNSESKPGVSGHDARVGLTKDRHISDSIFDGIAKGFEIGALASFGSYLRWCTKLSIIPFFLTVVN